MRSPTLRALQIDCHVTVRVRTRSAKSARMCASIASVLASWPVDLVKSRTGRGLAMTTGRQSLIKNMGSRISGDNWLVVLGGLSAFENRGAESLALMAFEAGDHHVKVQAIRTLGTYGGSKSVDLLLENFVSGDKQLQQAAAYAIERIPGNAMNGRVQKMLNSESSQDIKLAVSVLAHRNTPYRKNRLFRIIGGEDSELALAALKSISTNVEEIYVPYY